MTGGDDLRLKVRAKQPGDSVLLEVVRKGESMQVSAQLSSR